MDGKLVDQFGVQILLDDVRSACDPDVFLPCDLSGLRQGALQSVVYKVECGPTWAFPRLADFMGHNIDRRVKWRVLWPGTLPGLEHPLPHDADAGALEGVFQHPLFSSPVSPP